MIVAYRRGISGREKGALWMCNDDQSKNNPKGELRPGQVYFRDDVNELCLVKLPARRDSSAGYVCIVPDVVGILHIVSYCEIIIS